MSKLPSSAVVASRVEDVPTGNAVTLAPWMIAPEGSLTFPRISPVVCANVGTHNNTTALTSRHTRTDCVSFIAAPLESLRPPQTLPRPRFPLQLSEKPYYNSRTLVQGLRVVKEKLFWARPGRRWQLLRARREIFASATSRGLSAFLLPFCGHGKILGSLRPLVRAVTTAFTHIQTSGC